MRGNENLISQDKNILSALECQRKCQETRNCKLFNWNQEKSNCFLRSDLPKGLDSFNEKVPMAIIGARDCSDFRIIWPEIYGLNIAPTTTATTTAITTATTTARTTTTATTTSSTSDITTTKTASVSDEGAG
jgi:hypothetical protein